MSLDPYPKVPLSRDEQILRHPVCGPLATKVAEEQHLLTLDMLAGEPAASRAAVFHRATFQRLIERLPALSAGRVACGPACALCCDLRVEVQAYEALAIAGFLRQHRTPEELGTLTAALRERVRLLRKLSPAQQADARLRCLFLDAGDRCTIYPVRPIRCIGVTSTSRGICEAALQHEPGATRMTVYGPVMACTQGVLSGATIALGELGLDAGNYELSAAVLTALEVPEATERWLRGERAFAGQPPSAKTPRTPPPPTGLPGRNSPCPCGSGKKYKQCCLRRGIGD
jgi:hypothetical protein